MQRGSDAENINVPVCQGLWIWRASSRLSHQRTDPTAPVDMPVKYKHWNYELALRNNAAALGCHGCSGEVFIKQPLGHLIQALRKQEWLQKNKAEPNQAPGPFYM